MALDEAELDRRLWGAANALRGPVDPADFKSYVFPMLFWKWIADIWDYEHAQAVADFGDDRDLVADPVTLDEVLTVIDRRVQCRLNQHPTGNYRSIADQIEKLRRMAITRAEDSVEFLRKALELARAAVEADRLEAEGRLDKAATLLDPNIGALTQIVEQYKPDGTPVVVTDVVTDIDTIVRQVSFIGWTETQEGDRTVRKELPRVLAKYALPLTGPLFDAAYPYIRENY